MSRNFFIPLMHCVSENLSSASALHRLFTHIKCDMFELLEPADTPYRMLKGLRTLCRKSNNLECHSAEKPKVKKTPCITDVANKAPLQRRR